VTQSPSFASFDRLRNEIFDVVVVGGGMTGCGVAVDAASRGLKVALIEREDLASGTSSKSSKMVHGGLRYLQQREFALVYENLRERQRLLENAPHLISPLPFLIPLFGKNGVVSKAVARSYRTALWLYDITGGIRIGKRHRRIDQAETLAHFPTLNTKRLVAGFLYYDAKGDDARVALNLARSAEDRGAVIANYTSVTGYLTEGDRVVGVTASPSRGPHAGESIAVRAKVVVNAGGVWADEVHNLDGDTQASIRPAKGVHICVRADRLPCDIAAVIPIPKDRRSIFVVPFEGLPFTYLGTTDTDYEGPLEDPRCEAEDVSYLLDAVNALTSANLTSDDVTGVWAGLRPLIKPVEGHTVRKRTADLSRRHRVKHEGPGLVSITGGKWTTYRQMAEDGVDAVMEELKVKAKCKTTKLRLHGYADAAPNIHGLTSEEAHFLWRRFGSDALAVAEMMADDPSLSEAIVPGLPYRMAEVAFAVRQEWAQTLADVLERRTRLSIVDAAAAIEAAPKVAALMAKELAWDASSTQAQIEEAIARITADLKAAGLEQ
jgi:glycerol-3-phosphate dehydrogenase